MTYIIPISVDDALKERLDKFMETLKLPKTNRGNKSRVIRYLMTKALDGFEIQSTNETVDNISKKLIETITTLQSTIDNVNYIKENIDLSIIKEITNKKDLEVESVSHQDIKNNLWARKEIKLIKIYKELKFDDKFIKNRLIEERNEFFKDERFQVIENE